MIDQFWNKITVFAKVKTNVIAAWLKGGIHYEKLEKEKIA
jgi:hypothetical protein